MNVSLRRTAIDVVDCLWSGANCGRRDLPVSMRSVGRVRADIFISAHAYSHYNIFLQNLKIVKILRNRENPVNPAHILLQKI